MWPQQEEVPAVVLTSTLMYMYANTQFQMLSINLTLDNQWLHGMYTEAQVVLIAKEM